MFFFENDQHAQFERCIFNMFANNDNFMKMMEHLDGEPEWTDGQYVIGELS